MMYFLMLVSFAATYKVGHGAGEARERERHDRAVDEATKNITSLESWRK